MPRKSTCRTDSEGKEIDSHHLAELLLRAALDKKAQDPVMLDVEGLVSYADCFVICSAMSSRQVQAIADWVESRAKQAGLRPLSIEGRATGTWVLMDYGSVIMHIFHEPVREFYNLEGLWSDARRLPIPGEPGTEHDVSGTATMDAAS